MSANIKKVSLSLPQEMYDQMEELSQQIGISKSEFMRQALDIFIMSETRWQKIREWGEQTAKELNIKDEDDVDRIIHELRKEKP